MPHNQTGDAANAARNTNAGNNLGVQHSTLLPAAQPLTERDFAGLAASWITPGMAEQAGLFRVDSAGGAEIVGRKPKPGVDYAGIVFPYCRAGENRPRAYRLRRDNPDLEQKGNGTVKEVGKYLSAPGQRNSFYYPPDTTPEHLQDVSVPLCITEGEKKVLALHRLAGYDSLTPNTENEKKGLFYKWLSLGLSGVWNWRGIVGKDVNAKGQRQSVQGVIPDFDDVAWHERTVHIIYDANVATNESVARARRSLARELVRRGATVRLVDLPQVVGVNGVDDLLAHPDYGPTAVLSLIEGATEATAQPNGVSDGFRITPTGVFTETHAPDKSPVFVCAPLYVTALARDAHGNEWGRLLVWDDSDGTAHTWAMPAAMFAGDGAAYREELLRGGLRLGVNKRLLDAYLQGCQPTERVRCVARVGWTDSGAYILPDETIGADGAGERVIWQSEQSADTGGTSGTLTDWQENVARFCVGNSRLAFGVSVAFAGPLLQLAGMDGGGIHLRSGTSTGKTTALIVAGSVWGNMGGRGYIRSWRATANSLEAIAELHNDGFLCLDELGEADPHTAGATAYMLANGEGRGRMRRNTSLRRRYQWRMLYLSSGEVSLTELAAQSGHKTRGGQDVRLLDLPATAHATQGIIENLHGLANSGALINHLRDAAIRFYGTAAREFLRHVTENRAEIAADVAGEIAAFASCYTPDGAASEVERVARRFGLIAFAGELATFYGVTGWPEGEATNAAANCFRAWLDGRGTAGASDVEKGIQSVREFIERHGASRFQSAAIPDQEARVINRAGYFRTVERDGENVISDYLFTPSGFREACGGYEVKAVAAALAERGFLTAGKDKLQAQVKISGKNSRYYVVLPTPLEN